MDDKSQSPDGKGGQEKGGDQQGGDQKGGGDQGGGEKSQDGGGKKGDSGGKGSSGDQPGEGQPMGAKPGSQSGSQPGFGGEGSSGPGAPSAQGAEGQGSGNAFKPDAPNLEDRKKATNLALKRLQETLERGQIDPELQKELGYTDEELRLFMDRLQERLADNGDDNSPEAQARRRQFEQLLKGVNLQTETGRREGTGTGQLAPGYGGARKPVPAEYRGAEQRYRESLNKKK